MPLACAALERMPVAWWRWRRGGDEDGAAGSVEVEVEVEVKAALALVQRHLLLARSAVHAQPRSRALLARSLPSFILRECHSQWRRSASS